MLGLPTGASPFMWIDTEMHQVCNTRLYLPNISREAPLVTCCPEGLTSCFPFTLSPQMIYDSPTPGVPGLVFSTQVIFPAVGHMWVLPTSADHGLFFGHANWLRIGVNLPLSILVHCAITLIYVITPCSLNTLLLLSHEVVWDPMEWSMLLCPQSALRYGTFQVYLIYKMIWK